MHVTADLACIRPYIALKNNASIAPEGHSPRTLKLGLPPSRNASSTAQRILPLHEISFGVPCDICP